tara:strand:+ start:17296 stop:17526 length:231 start_codon:yes stop_codon:yes gene_type:complete
MIKLFIELLMLIKQLVSSNKAKGFREDVEDVKRDPSGRWAKLFGRVQPDPTDSIDDSRFNDNTEGMPTSNTKATKR